MRTVRIGQTLALVCIILVVALQAAAQAPAPPAVATAPYAPVALPGLDWLALIKEVGFPAAAFVLHFILYRTSLSETRGRSTTCEAPSGICGSLSPA
jgi:hypothetical protein